MKSPYRLIVLLIVLFSVSILSSAQSSSLTTSFTTNTRCDGNYFDVIATSDLTIDSFDVNIYDNTTTVSVYYKIGTHVGSETTQEIGHYSVVRVSQVHSIHRQHCR